ncbi:MAG: alpha/beta hydrolase [Rhizobiaceae bacterium]|nr:alpha/beta hydrolase [Rhizobiaceae bacterium]
MTDTLPTGFRSDFINCCDVRLHLVHNGMPYEGAPLKDSRKPILMLHGFPEFWLAWESVMQALGDEYLILVPDQRGYNKSDAPTGADNYKARLLVKDMLNLTSAVLGDRTFSLAGHDWGASIAYALAINFPEKVDHLLIANGVHPACFQKAMIDNPAQAKASAYFHILRQADAAPHMCANDFVKTFSMFEKFSLSPWLDEPMKQRYRQAWSDEDRMAAMLHWYNSSPIVVPKEGADIPDAPLYDVGPDQFRVTMPHTLVWGLGDQALLPATQQNLDVFCDDLRRVEVENADHWILHTHGELVADAIRELIG